VVNGYDSNVLLNNKISYGFGRVGSNPALDGILFHSFFPIDVIFFSLGL
jgi:hypothetical protein